MTTLPRNDNGQLDAFAWPGGYPLFYLDRENSVLCVDCARKSDTADEIDGFKPVAVDVNWEDDSLFCDNCSKQIEAAYV